MVQTPEFNIAGRRIADDEPPYVVAEISANHLGQLDHALRTIHAAAKSGADAVKFQTYTADTITLNHDSADFIVPHGAWKGATLHELYTHAHTPWAWHERLFEEARNCGLTAFSSPFDSTAVDFLISLNTAAYKIASFEIVDLPLIEACVRTGMPIIISTGMASLAEIERAVEAVRGVGDGGLCLLHCVSAYPAPASDMNLRRIPHLGATFGVVPGLSDHTLGTAVPVAAVALGARLIEKHFTLDRSSGGPDADFSIEPDELKRMIQDCRIAWESLGKVTYGPQKSEFKNKEFRRSLYAVEDIEQGEAITSRNVKSVRPGHGLCPSELPQVLKSRARRRIARGTPLAHDLLTYS